MAHADTIIFIAPDLMSANEFANIVEEHYTDCKFRPEPIKSNGTYATSEYVFFLGLRHMNHEVVDALKAHDWPKGAVIWIQGDTYGERSPGWISDIVGPEIMVCDG